MKQNSQRVFREEQCSKSELLSNNQLKLVFYIDITIIIV